MGRLTKLLRKSKHSVISPSSARFTMTKLQKHGHKKTMAMVCQLISNYSMNQETAAKFVSMGAVDGILSIIERAREDPVITWLACSALWNLARPASTRNLIPTKMFTVLKKLLKTHGDQKQIVQCALGALSNVVISDKFQKVMCTSEFMATMVSKWDQFAKEETVATAATGCVANMAIDGGAEDMLIEAGVIGRLMASSQMFPENVDINRSISAALSNLCNAASFKSSVVDCQGVERVYHLIDITENGETRHLLFNVLEAMELSADKPTTSLHLAAGAGKLAVCTAILQSDPACLDKTNADGLTALDEAVCNRRRACTHLLSAVGGRRASELAAKQMVQGSEGPDIRTGRNRYAEIKVAYIKSVSRTVGELPVEICQEIVTNLCGVDRYMSTNDVSGNNSGKWVRTSATSPL